MEYPTYHALVFSWYTHSIKDPCVYQKIQVIRERRRHGCFHRLSLAPIFQNQGSFPHALFKRGWVKSIFFAFLIQVTHYLTQCSKKIKKLDRLETFRTNVRFAVVSQRTDHITELLTVTHIKLYPRITIAASPLTIAASLRKKNPLWYPG